MVNTVPSITFVIAIILRSPPVIPLCPCKNLILTTVPFHELRSNIIIRETKQFRSLTNYSLFRSHHFALHGFNQNGDCRRQEPTRDGQNSWDGGIARRGDHHDSVQRRSDHEPLEATHTHAGQQRRASELVARTNPRIGQLLMLVHLVHFTGVLNQAVPSPLFADGMDVHGWRDSVSRVRGVDAAQAPRLDDRFSWTQILVRRLLGKYYIQLLCAS